MKPITLITILLIGACQGRPGKDYTVGTGVKIVAPAYHIRVAPFSTGEYYQIQFTNDNWASYEAIQTVLDLTDLDLEVVKQEYLTSDCKQAVNLAKTFRTYQSAIEYNERVAAAYKAKQEYYANHPKPVQKPEPPPETPECKEQMNVY